MAYTVRDATEDDCQGIVDLIQGLADFDSMSDHMKLTPEQLRKDGFGSHQFYKCVVAEKSIEGKAQLVGYALGFFIYSTFKGRSFFLEDLYVHPDHRGQGIGTAQWRRLSQIAVSHNCQRMDFSVAEWNHSAIDFYKQKGCLDLTVEEKWHIYRLPLDEMQKMAQGQ